MSNVSQNNPDYYEDYKKRLSQMIFERSKGEVPEFMCDRFAKLLTNHKKYDDSKGVHTSMEEYADIAIWVYDQ